LQYQIHTTGKKVMTAKAKIKVIKKGEVKIVEPTPTIEKKPKQAAREMVSTVSNWVNEFQQRQRIETKQAIEKFFSNQPQTNGV
jgi:ribosomal protein L30E